MDRTVDSHEVEMNRVAQARDPVASFERWWRAIDPAKTGHVITLLTTAVVQAQPKNTDVPLAAERMRMKGDSPAVSYLSSRKRSLRNSVLRLWQQPRFSGEPEAAKILVGLLSVADERRRAACGGTCRHWWHQDLSKVTEHPEVDGPKARKD